MQKSHLIVVPVDRDLAVVINRNGAPLSFLITLYKPITFYTSSPRYSARIIIPG